MRVPLPTVSDRACSPRALDNGLRRWLAPPRREIRLLAPAPGDAVADLGAGVGYFVSEILDHIGTTGRVLLVDRDSRNLRIASTRNANDPRVVILESSIAQLRDIPDDSLDCVLLSLVLCCLVNKEAAMDEAWRILRPGGRALITYPSIGLALRRRRPSLRVRPERWAQLLVRRPWRELPSPRRWLVRTHLLLKPPRTALDQTQVPPTR